MSVTFLTNEDYQAILSKLQELETAINNSVRNETDPTVPSWAKQSTKPSYTASEVGADSSGTAAAKVSEHNTSEVSHNDIRLLITGLTDRLNALANSDDTTLDQMNEVVAYIKSNKSLIEAITTNKVNVTDIIDNLTTNVSNKPLSAKQGVALKALIDNIIIPTKLSQFTDDVGYAKQTEVDQLSEEIGVLTLGLHTDGLVYLFNNGVPQGNGIAMVGGETGDVIGNVDSSNTIILNGNLPSGDYTVKYEMEDGSLMDIGNLTVVSGGTEEPEETNYFDISTAQLNHRLGSGGNASSYNGMVTTDYIPVDSSMTEKNFIISGITPVLNTSYNYAIRTCFYNADKSKVDEHNYADGVTSIIPYKGTDGFIKISIVIKDNVAIENSDVSDLMITLE